MQLKDYQKRVIFNLKIIMNNIEKHLNQLGKMLKKRENPAFGSDLRNELLRRANVMNSAKVESRQQDTNSRGGLGFALTPFWKKAFATATAFALLVAVVSYSILPGGTKQAIQLVNIAEAQDYYALTPETEDTSGVSTDSGFILESKGVIDAGEVEDAIVITPETDFEVEQVSETSVEITPAEPLQEGEVYSIELNAQDMESSPYKTEYSWAYQVSEDLRIAGTLPANKTTNIPLNAGIEINFNYNGVQASDIENYYSIEPATRGGWDSKGKTAVFVPADPLTALTIYTVTIKTGLPLGGSEKVLAEDYVFQFETYSEYSSDGNLSFSSEMFNFAPNEVIDLPVYYWETYGEETESPTVSMQVYSYDGAEDFLSAIEAKQDNSLDWAWNTSELYSSSVEGLNLLIDQSTAPLLTSQWDHFIELPQALDQGYYLLKISKGDTKAEAFLQVSNLATYVSLSNNESIVWVNDLSTGMPVSGADVSVEKLGSTKTDSNGLAVIQENFPQPDSYDGDSENFNGIVKVSSGDSTVYYLYDYYSSSPILDNWKFFETERDTYHPTDKVYYWGFLKGRTEPLKGDAQLIITNWPWVWDAKYLAENDYVLHTEDVELKDGDVFSGSVDIEKFNPGYYALEIVQDDMVIATAAFSVQDFVKPAYELTVTPENPYLFVGESTNVNIEASFFEGTPVSNLDLQAYYGAKGVDGDGQVTTDENGKVVISYIADNNSWCQAFSYCDLIYSDYISVSPINEEEGSIWGDAKITTVESLVGSEEITVDYDENLKLQTKFVDMDKVKNPTDGWISSYSDIYGDIAPNTKVVTTVSAKKSVKTDIGQYYDYINKVTKTQYEYSEVDISTETLTLATDAEGNLDYDLGLNPEYIYQIDVAIYDANGNYYRSQHYLYPSSNDYYYGYTYYEFDGLEESYDIGETVSASITSSDEAPMPSDGSYKYFYAQSKNGTYNSDISSTPSYSFEFTDEMIPNVTVWGVIFDGKSYHDVNQATIVYDYESKRIDVDISSDKDSYGPGDNVTIDVNASEESSVNLYLVDEAYYSLFSESVTDPLEGLYGTVSDGVLYRFASTESLAIDMGGKGGCFKAGTKILMSDGSYKNIEDIRAGDEISTRENAFVNKLVSGNVVKTYEHYVDGYILINGYLGVTGEHIMFINGQWNLASNIELGDVLINKDGSQVFVSSIEQIDEPTAVYNFEVENYHTYFADNIYVHNDKGGTREILKDTALFEVVDTDSSGNASVTFTLPDNVTSWRVVASAINGDSLMAGLGTANINVTKPVITLPVINSEYVLGDQPSIPIRAYGDYLTAESTLKFGVDIEDMDYSESQDGTAYQNVYFNIDNLTEGEHKIVTWSEIDDEGDSLATNTNVVKSHFSIQKIWDAILTENTKLEGSSEDRTTVTFINGEVGNFYSMLVGESYNDGKRADQMASKFVAQKLLTEYFDEEFQEWEFPTFDYQSEPDIDGGKGGIGLLDYDSDRLPLSAKLAALDSSLWSTDNLKKYFESFFSTDSYTWKGDLAPATQYTLTEKITAIYGLAAIDENYLNELNYLVANNELTLEDKIFAALAYLEFGSKSQASDLYLDIIQNYSEADSDYIKITDNGASLDDELSWTALAAVIAAETGSDGAEQLWSFVSTNDDLSNRGRSELVDVEKLLYAKSLLDLGADAKVSFKLNGEKISLEGNDIYTLSMLPSELESVQFSAISGSVKVITDYAEVVDPSTLEASSDLSIVRKYYVDGVETNVLQAGELVTIQLTVTVPGDVEGIYSVTDYLPSGLKLTYSGYSYYDQGQSISFGVGYNPFQEENYEGWELCSDNPDGSVMCTWYTTYEEYAAAAGISNDPSNNPPYTETITYTARVINKGVFVAEPAVIQDAENSSILNVSGKTGSLVIE